MDAVEPVAGAVIAEIKYLGRIVSGAVLGIYLAFLVYAVCEGDCACNIMSFRHNGELGNDIIFCFKPEDPQRIINIYFNAFYFNYAAEFRAELKCDPLRISGLDRQMQLKGIDRVVKNVVIF